MEIESIKEMLLRKKVAKKIQQSDLLSSGSVLLNLACSGKRQGAFAKGTYVLLVGDSQSGKSFLSNTCLAEAKKNPAFDKYRMIYDDVEHGSLMDIEKFFGKKLADCLEPPKRDKDGEPVYSETVEDLYYNIHDAMEEGPCIYICDSMDGLSSVAERDKFIENKKASEKGTKGKGDYGDGKAKTNSRNIRTVVAKLRDTGSILIVISQTRDNIGASMFEPQQTFAGGHALKFYATLQLWSSVGKTIKRTIREKDRPVGIICRVRIKKNRLTGRDRTIELPIYYEMGFDDIGGCIDYLVEEKHWKSSKGSIDAPEFGHDGKRGHLIKKIEDEGLENDLHDLVAEVWNELESELAMNRKPRYE